MVIVNLQDVSKVKKIIIFDHRLLTAPSGRFLHSDTELDALLDDADLVGFNFHPDNTMFTVTVL